MASQAESGRGRPEAHTVAEVRAALELSGGIIAHAAEKLGCARSTVRRMCEQHEELQEVRAEVSESIVDLAESQLIKALREGNMTAVIFLLKTKGRSRGYVERMEHTGNVNVIREIKRVIVRPGDPDSGGVPAAAGAGAV
jgi:hypothetical protein